MKKIIVSLVLIGWAGAGSAAVVYTYTGNNFTDVRSSQFTTDDYVGAQLRLNAALLPNQHYSDLTLLPGFALEMTAGSAVIDSQSKYEAFYANVTTGSTGNIEEWAVGLRFVSGTAAEGIVTCSPRCFEDFSDYAGFTLSGGDINFIASNTNNPGDWTVQTVPLPAAGWLFISAIGGLVARKKFAKV